MVELCLKQAKDIMMIWIKNDMNYFDKLCVVDDIKPISIENILKYLWLYYGSREYDFTFIKKLMDRLDIEIYYKKLTDINLNQDEINKLLNFIDIIQEESKTWDEWSIITGTSLNELKTFKQYLTNI